MPTADQAILYYEAAPSAVAMVALSDSGDHISFNSADEFWSKRAAFFPNVKPNGKATGADVAVAASGSDDVVDVPALTCYLAGVLTSVDASADESITRAVAADTHIINSITVTAAGAIAVIAGTDSTSFSETRGAAGGPPWIPTGSIELAQIRLSGNVAAPVTADEIFQAPSLHAEWYNDPTWSIKSARVENQIQGYAGVDFDFALPQIHSDDAGTTTSGKKVYASYYEPVFSPIAKSTDFVRPKNSKTVSSKQYYGATSGSVSTSLGNGSFSMEAQDGVTDRIMQLEGELLWFKFYPNRLQAVHEICQGYLSVNEKFSPSENITIDCTIAAEEAGLLLSA